MTFRCKQGDRARTLRARLEDATGRAVPLTGAAIRFRMEPDVAGLRDAVEGPAVLLDAATAEVGYSWAEGDTDVPGLYSAEFRVVYGNGQPETFPGEGYIDVVIERRMAGHRRKQLADVGAAIAELVALNPGYGQGPYGEGAYGG